MSQSDEHNGSDCKIHPMKYLSLTPSLRFRLRKCSNFGLDLFYSGFISQATGQLSCTVTVAAVEISRFLESIFVSLG